MFVCLYGGFEMIGGVFEKGELFESFDFGDWGMDVIV